MATAPGPSGEEIARAVRLLRLRGRREATGLFSGSSLSPFHGAGLEFEESRPYVAGDDVATLDWHATARTGRLFVKRHREERSHTLLLALDTSASMAFRSDGPSKVELAARVIALLTAAAARAGDRTALVAFDQKVIERIAPGRGGAHGLRLLRCAARAAAVPERNTRVRGETQHTNFGAGFEALRRIARGRATAVLLSDFRRPANAPDEFGRRLADLARQHDVIALGLRDPAEIRLPRVGLLRITDGSRGGRSRLLNTSRRRVRAGYQEAAEARRRSIDAQFAAAGAEARWLRTDESPLETLARLFAARATGRRERR